MISNKQRALAEEQSFNYHEFDTDIVDYLRSSPDFFARHPELLMEIEVPHYERGAVSLVEKRLALHREQYEDLRERLGEIVEVAHRNDYLADLLHEYSVGLIAADSIVEVFELTRTTLAEKLQCEDIRTIIARNEVVDLCMDDACSSVVLTDNGFSTAVADLHTRKAVYCGHASQERIERFFPATTLNVKSVAIIKLSHHSAGTDVVDMGYLALASEDKSRFAPHMATDFLQRFGALLSARLAVFYN
jgi:uncharacterized protein YigA (DUF484 family)